MWFSLSLARVFLKGAGSCYNHGQKSWDTFAFLGRIPMHTGPTPALTPQTMLDACIQNFFRVSTLYRIGGGGTTGKLGLSAGTGKLCIFGHLRLVFIWSCFVSRLLFLLYYVICAPVLTEGTGKFRNGSTVLRGNREMTGKYEYCSTVPRTFVQDCRCGSNFV